MLQRIVEIGSNNRYLSLYRGFLKLSYEKEEVGRVALVDIGALVLNAHGLSYSNDLIVALNEQKIPVVICGRNCAPTGWIWPNNSNQLQARKMDAQAASTLPQNKRIWQTLVRTKIAFQADLLAYAGKPSAPLSALVVQVKSGDSTNVEAQAAKKYWRLFFGDEFRRNRELEGINALLNYGYTVLRAATARAVMATGLHPTLSIYHKNQYNALRLVDDLMEPFRVCVDAAVSRCLKSGIVEISPESKAVLVECLYSRVDFDGAKVTVIHALYKLSSSLAQMYMGEARKLSLPSSILFDDIQASDDAEWISINVDTDDV